MKPISMSVKDWVVSQTAKEIGIDEELYSYIISWSYAKVAEATQLVKSIELSGFGKLLISDKKIERRIKNKEKYIDVMEGRMNMCDDIEKIALLKTRIQSAKRNIEHLKTKLPGENSMERHS